MNRRYKLFIDFINEKTAYINVAQNRVSNQKGAQTLGSIDTERNKDKLTQIKNILLPDLDSPLIRFLQNKKIPLENKAQIKSLINKFFIGDDPEDLIRFLLTPNVSDISYNLNPIDGSHIAVSDIINHYSEMFDAKFFSSLIELEGKGKPVVGRNELFYIMMIANFYNATDGGDIVGNNQVIEVKQRKGRYGGTKGTKDGLTAKNEIAAAFESYYKVKLKDKTKGFGAKTAIAIIDAYKEADPKKMNPDFIKALILGCANYDRKTIADALTMPSLKFLESILRSGDSKSLQAYITALHLLGYQKVEKFKWLFIMTDDRKHICTLNTATADIKAMHKFNLTYFSNAIGWAADGPDRMGATIGTVRV